MSSAVLFDLDDTLVDLQYSRRHGLRAVQEVLPELKRVPLEELELVHDEELQANYLRTLDDSLSDEEARLEHMRGICRHYGLETNRVADAADAYVREQQSNPRLVPGVEELFEAPTGMDEDRCRHQWLLAISAGQAGVLRPLASRHLGNIGGGGRSQAGSGDLSIRSC